MTKCLICKSNLGSIFSMGMQPLANKYPASVDQCKTEIMMEMYVFHCENCNYINIPCSIDRNVFFEDYYYLSSVNKELVDHFDDLAETVNELERKFVLDVGSNDGILLRQLRMRNIRCLGIDPSENVSRIANEEGLETLVGFFDANSASYIQDRYGKPDLICASSVFTHLENPHDFFDAAGNILADRGQILIEVEYLGSIIDSLGFERFYFDRPHYYSIKTLKLIANSAGFDLISVTPIRVHGGSIRCIFARNDSKTVADDSVQKAIDSEDAFLNRKNIMQNFNLFGQECSNLISELEKFKKEGKKVFGYGCPARLSTITNFAGVDSNLLPGVVDDSPLKIGRFSPGKHIPILASSEASESDVFVVFAYEYINSIRSKQKSKQVSYFRPIPFQLI